MLPMRARHKHVLILFAIVCTLPVFWISLFTKQDLHYNEVTDKRFVELQEKLHAAELVGQQKESDLHVLRSQFSHVMQIMLHSSNRTENRSRTDMLPGNLLSSQLANVSDMNSQGSLHLPSLFTYLPHLMGKPDSLKPKYQLSRSRFGASIIIGIPTIKRHKISYLNSTISSLINAMTPDERNECLIVVFVAEPDDYEYVEKVGQDVKEKFSHYVEDGLLEVISPSPDFYPNIDDVPQTYGDTKERVRWRTKQNLDFSFLMLYARSRGVYYVQLEDDVISKPGFFTVMKTFAEHQNSREWILLEFSTLGFIGKMFKSSDLPMVVEFFLMFYKDKPIDWLLDYLLAVKVCNPEKDAKHCNKMKAEVRRRYKPSLFQHIGMQSSLKGKVQKLKDRDFGKHMLHRAHVNPAAILKTSLKAYQKFTLHKAYIGEDIFWATAPSIGDFVEITLTPPVYVEEILCRTGNPEHLDDKIYDATVKVKTVIGASSVLKQSGYPQDGRGFFSVGKFDSNGLAVVKLNDGVDPIQVVSFDITATSQNWIIISEIHIKERKTTTKS